MRWFAVVLSAVLLSLSGTAPPFVTVVCLTGIMCRRKVSFASTDDFRRPARSTPSDECVRAAARERSTA